MEILEFEEGMFDSQDSKCSICLSNYEIKDKIRILPCTPIKHHFHQLCIDEWLVSHNNCPFCTSEIPTTKTKEEENQSQTSSREMLI